LAEKNSEHNTIRGRGTIFGVKETVKTSAPVALCGLLNLPFAHKRSIIQLMAQKEAKRALELDAEATKGLARRLRHEVGDFLQKVYASVAILQGRMPPEWQQEREILLRLRRQAESCRNFVDALQDFLCPVTLSLETFDVTQLTTTIAREAETQWPRLKVRTEGTGPATVTADLERIGHVGKALIANACEAARGQVTWRVVSIPETREIEWIIRDDGPGIAAETSHLLFTPFFSTRPGHAGLGLALARKLILLHGGEITAGNLAQGGFQVRVVLPQTMDAPSKDGDAPRVNQALS
jgi:signal transduction histidine kinase